ncbi:Uncharacterized protein YcsI, UPF0317 family [Burkholderia sp. GAS332]|nr:Uncharacterized protein YcsI, UPF0317 family [Burkholderia sp. GAS332]
MNTNPKCFVTPKDLRTAIRSGDFSGYTAGLAPGYVQANICILPRDFADEFLLYCQCNPQPCPLIARSNVGEPYLPALGKDIDIRFDVPRYHLFKCGELTAEVTDISSYWSDDLVTFALGCSFSFEEALLDAGLSLRYLERGDVAGVYQTNLPTKAAGRFSAPIMVTMRPFTPADAIRAIQITSGFPRVHGAPIHLGDPAAIGVDLDRRYRDIGSKEVGDQEIPLFWACGLTPQLAVMHAKPPLCITHAPSSMLVTDLRNSSLAVL